MIRFLPLVVLSLQLLISFGSATLEIDRYERQVLSPIVRDHIAWFIDTYWWFASRMQMLHALQAAFGNQFVIDIHVVQISNTGKTPEVAWQWCTTADLAPHLAIITVTAVRKRMHVYLRVEAGMTRDRTH
jgi:hypothetical protein